MGLEPIASQLKRMVLYQLSYGSRLLDYDRRLVQVVSDDIFVSRKVLWTSLRSVKPASDFIWLRMVEVMGFAPIAFCVQSRRSPEWAKPPFVGDRYRTRTCIILLVKQTLHLSDQPALYSCKYLFLFEIFLYLFPDPLLPKVSVCVWQLGHRSLRLSGWLLSLLPSMWSTCKVSCLLFQSGPWPHKVHFSPCSSIKHLLCTTRFAHSPSKNLTFDWFLTASAAHPMEQYRFSACDPGITTPQNLHGLHIAFLVAETSPSFFIRNLNAVWDIPSSLAMTLCDSPLLSICCKSCIIW